MNFNKKIIATASILGAITIAIGAFGAHGLKELIDAKSLATFETGVRYQMYHVFALLIVGFASVIPSTTQKWVALFFMIGIIFFSGSIYLLSLNELFVFDAKSIGFITPIGGLFFIMGWLRLAYGVIVNK
ncbi:MAG: DUF423 domain-containing protein [Flavobacteriaceae bacterium]|nr:DUF423 domain-containing protein [Flavobacteriaceae bacterium]